MATGLQSMQDYYASLPTNQQPQQPGFFQNYGRHIIPALGGALQGAAGAYGINQGYQQLAQQNAAQAVQNQAANQQQVQQPNQSMMGPMAQGLGTSQLSDLLNQLLSQKLDRMGQGVPQQQPSQPDQLMAQAGQVANAQTGSQQGPPQYTPTGPQFAFDQYLGAGGAMYNPLASLGDLGSGSSGNTNRPWQRDFGNQVGGLLQTAAPFFGGFGPLGALGGAAAGGLGYGLQQL